MHVTHKSDGLLVASDAAWQGCLSVLLLCCMWCCSPDEDAYAALVFRCLLGDSYLIGLLLYETRKAN